MPSAGEDLFEQEPLEQHPIEQRPIEQRPIDEDVVGLDQRAVEAGLGVVRGIGLRDLSRPTPCPAWTLADLLAHMTAQHRGFRAASLGLSADPQIWATRRDADPVAAYLSAADDVMRAFAAPGVLDHTFLLPEISAGTSFPARTAIGFHLVDYVVHGWDVARSLGEPFEVDDELAEVALRIAQQVPDGPERLRPDASFLPSLPDESHRAAAGAAAQARTALERTLRLLGRSPSWDGPETRP